MKDQNDGGIAVTTTRAFCRKAGDTPLAPEEPLTFAAGTSGFVWELHIRRTDGKAFEAGRYSVNLALGGAAETLRMADGSFSRADRTAIPLTIQLGVPRTAEEIGAMYVFRAHEALLARDYAGAAKAAQQALYANPADLSPK